MIELGSCTHEFIETSFPTTAPLTLEAEWFFITFCVIEYSVLHLSYTCQIPVAPSTCWDNQNYLQTLWKGGSLLHLITTDLTRDKRSNKSCAFWWWWWWWDLKLFNIGWQEYTLWDIHYILYSKDEKSCRISDKIKSMGLIGLGKTLGMSPTAMKINSGRRCRLWVDCITDAGDHWKVHRFSDIHPSLLYLKPKHSFHYQALTNLMRFFCGESNRVNVCKENLVMTHRGVWPRFLSSIYFISNGLYQKLVRSELCCRKQETHRITKTALLQSTVHRQRVQSKFHLEQHIIRWIASKSWLLTSVRNWWKRFT